MLTIDEGKIAVKLAREALTQYVKKHVKIKPESLPKIFDEKQGVFVSLHKSHNLRGCIGYPQPFMPLGLAIIDSAISAAARDPRFPSIRPEELEDVVIEVTILTAPKNYDVENTKLPEVVQIGRHGLIVSHGMFTGLLLPQVAIEWGFDSIDFLSQTCLKAGLPPDSWLDPRTDVRYFEGQIFAEAGQEGDVIEKDIMQCE